MPAWLVARITFLEVLRKKDFYVLLILLGLYTLVAVVILQAHAAEEAVRRLLFSLGLTCGFGAAAVLVVVLAARQVPKEIEQGTILPLLARPLTRWQFLWGKFVACWLVGVVSLVAFAFLIRLLVAAPAQFNEVLFVQAVALKIAGLAALTAITLTLSLFMPEALTIAVSLGYYFLWGVVFNIIQSGLQEATGNASWFAGRALYVFPHLEILDVPRLCLAQTTPLAWGLTLALLIYAAGYTAIALLVAQNLFEKRWV
jgi:ABC-type transport system involved in multi-copper enzyme maturation permease subunit